MLDIYLYLQYLQFYIRDHPCYGHLTSDPVLGGVHGVGGEPGPDPCLYYYALSKLQRLKDKRYSECDTLNFIIHTQNHTKKLFNVFIDEKQLVVIT